MLFDGAMQLLKAVIKVLYHSLEQQNELQSWNYCPIIFRIIKPSPASTQVITSPSSALPSCLLPVSISSVSSVRASPLARPNPTRSWVGYGSRLEHKLVAPISFVLRLQFPSLLLPMHFLISAPENFLEHWSRSREWRGKNAPFREPSDENHILHEAIHQLESRTSDLMWGWKTVAGCIWIPSIMTLPSPHLPCSQFPAMPCS